MDLKGVGLDPRLLDFFFDHIDFYDEGNNKSWHAPSRDYVRDSMVVAKTQADIVEYPKDYKFVVDMPGLKTEHIKVQLEDNTLVVCGERSRDMDKDHKDVKYLRMERRHDKFLKKFDLPDNANADNIFANYQDGVLSVTVDKKPPPQPKHPQDHSRPN